MAFRAYSAKSAAVRIAGATITAKQWDVTPNADEIETTNFEGGGAYECIGGITSAAVQIQLDDNGLANIFDAGIVAGAILTNVRLYLNGVAGPYWYFPYLFVSSPAQRADVKAAMGDTITGKGTGAFTYPTGNAVS